MAPARPPLRCWQIERKFLEPRTVRRTGETVKLGTSQGSLVITHWRPSYGAHISPRQFA